MAFSAVNKRRRLRGLVRGHGKYTLEVPAQRHSFEEAVKPKRADHGLNKASAPRLSGPYEKRVA